MRYLTTEIKKPTKRNVYSLLVLVYLMTVSVEFFSTEINAVIQNIAYLGFIGLRVVDKKNDPNFKFNGFLKTYGVFLLYACASMLWSADRSGAMILFRIFMKMYVIMFFAVDYYLREGRLDEFLTLVYMSILISVVYVLINATPQEWAYERLGKKHGIDTVRLAVRMAMGAYIGYYRWRKGGSVFNLVVCVALLGVSFCTGKRTGAIFIAVAYIIYNLCVQKQYWKKLWKLVQFGILLGLAWTVIMSIPALRETLGERTLNFVETLFHGQSSDASTVERLQLINYAMGLFKEHLLFGSGLNGMRAYLKQVGFYHVTYAHNNYLEIATGLGSVGVVLFYSTYLFPMVKAYKSLRITKDNDNAFIISFLAGLLISDLVQVTYESYFEMFLICVLITFINKRDGCVSE